MKQDGIHVVAIDEAEDPGLEPAARRAYMVWLASPIGYGVRWERLRQAERDVWCGTARTARAVRAD